MDCFCYLVGVSLSNYQMAGQVAEFVGGLWVWAKSFLEPWTKTRSQPALVSLHVVYVVLINNIKQLLLFKKIDFSSGYWNINDCIYFIIYYFYTVYCISANKYTHLLTGIRFSMLSSKCFCQSQYECQYVLTWGYLIQHRFYKSKGFGDTLTWVALQALFICCLTNQSPVLYISPLPPLSYATESLLLLSVFFFSNLFLKLFSFFTRSIFIASLLDSHITLHPHFYWLC